MILTSETEIFINPSTVKINYSRKPVVASEFHIPPHELLFETGIQEQNIQCNIENNYKVFFKTGSNDFGFDIFAATFYLLSRYEEYLPHVKDLYGRYAHTNSLAFKESFLKLPIINIWIADLVAAIQRKFSAFHYQVPTFNFIPTYDIDIAWSYKHKGWWRNIGGFIKSPSAERVKVISGLQNDPFDAYAWLNELHKQYKLKPVYFFLLANKNNDYDKNILPNKIALKNLIASHGVQYQTGIHPSWQSGDNFLLMKQEKKLMESITNLPVTNSRQHYIRFHLPSSFRRLLEAGITDDYSMGYGSINGFRASVASSFYWYDLEHEKQTSLRIHPFCFMEANSFYEQKFTAQQAYEEIMHYSHACKEVNGTLLTIWHNNFLGTAKEFKGWKEVYQQFIAQVRQ